MRNRWLVLAALLGAGAVEAGPFVSIEAGGPAASATASGRSPGVRVPSPFTEGSFLCWRVVVGSDGAAVDIGRGTPPVEVKLVVDGERATLACTGATVARLGLPDGTPLMLGTATRGPDELRVAFDDGATVRSVSGTVYAAEAPQWTIQVISTAQHVAFTQRYRMLARGKPRGTDPAALEVALRTHMWMRTPSASVTPFTPADRTTAGVFSLVTAMPVDGRSPGANGDLMYRLDPSRPVRFLVHPSVPEKDRGEIAGGIRSWNGAFRAVANTTPVVVENGPDTVLPGEPGVFVIYWHGPDVPRSEYGHAGSLVDPRDGAIIGGSILLSERNISGSGVEAAHRDLDSAARGRMAIGPIEAFVEGHIAPPGAALAVAGEPSLRTRLLRWVTVHESGHALGLRHNFKASADVERLPGGEVTTSVMDYPDLARAPGNPLPHDIAALARVVGAAPPAAFAGPYLYASDESSAVDPDANKWDAGEPMAFAMDRIARFRGARDRGQASGDRIHAYGNAVFPLYEILAKMLMYPNDPRHAAVSRFLMDVLADQGPEPAVAGGNQSAVEMNVPVELMVPKRVADRIAAIHNIADVAAIVRDDAPLAPALSAIAAIAADPARTDVFNVRAVAAMRLAELGGPAARKALGGALASIRAYRATHPGAPTDAQDAAILELAVRAPRAD